MISHIIMTTSFLAVRIVGAFMSIGLLFSSCQNEDAEPDEQEIAVAAFEGLEVRAGSTIELTEGPTQKIELRGGSGDWGDKLRKDVNNGIWRVEFDGNVPDQDRLTIHVTMPRLRRLVHTGPGTVRGLTSFTYPTLHVENTGSGSVVLGTLSPDVLVEVKGSGPVELTGTAASQVVHVTGSGSYRGFGLATAHTDATVSGSGNADVWATSTLRATAPGSGNVRYKGRPVITASTPGQGRVIDSN